MVLVLQLVLLSKQNRIALPNLALTPLEHKTDEDPLCPMSQADGQPALVLPSELEATEVTFARGTACPSHGC